MEAIANAKDTLVEMASNDTKLNVEAVVEGAQQILDSLNSTRELTSSLTGSSAGWGLAACLLALVSFLVSAVIGTWRFWAFTIRPRLHPEEPKELPSWFPYFGHAYGFFDDSQGLISYARDSLSDTDEPYDHPFAMTLTGQKFYVLTSEKDVTVAFQNPKKFSRDGHLRDSMLKFGVSQSGISKILNEERPEDPRYANKSNPKRKALIPDNEEIFSRWLTQGETLDDLTDKLCNNLEKSLRQDDLPRRRITWESGKTVTLMDFCADVAITTMTRSLLSDSVYDIDSELSQNLYGFNDQAWKLLVIQYPRPAAPKLHRAKHRICQTLYKFLQSPAEKRGDESALMKPVLEEQQAAGLDDKNRAAMMFMFLATANLHAYRLSFWLLSYTLFNKDLLSIIQEEIAPSFQKPGKTNHRHIYENCPRFSAIYTEILRLTSGSISMRTVTTPVQMSGKTLKPGNTAMIPIRCLHYNEAIFGDNAEEFDATRFLGNKLEKSPLFRPFAGDAPDLSGHLLTKRLTMLLVATVLQRFGLEVVANPLEEGRIPQIPDIDQVTPTLGVMGPVTRTEIFVKVREREDRGGEKKVG